MYNIDIHYNTHIINIDILNHNIYNFIFYNKYLININLIINKFNLLNFYYSFIFKIIINFYLKLYTMIIK